ncbi:head GIN domain-containing protein [Polaribacter uvawellassae]|uniref:head GIN domain-containing protein n=1 Tax=Polaribacter uvawellassae TaxID=3133495 RepID=UPI00321ABA6C
MKSIITKAFAFLFIATVSTSCMLDGINTVTGNRNVITETRKINDDFTKIEIGQGIQLYITQDSDLSLVVKADENLHKLIRTEVVNGVLKISSKRNIRRAKSKKIYLSAPNINAIKATSGSDVVTENTINADIFDAHVSSGADARIDINADTVNSSSSSGADLRLNGKANYFSAKATSGSSIRAYGLESKNATVKVNSGADIDVHVVESLTAKASSGGDIDYRGNPKRIDKKKSSGGSISSN